MLKILFRLAAPLLFCAALCIPARAVSGSDALLLDRLQRECFLYMWEHAYPSGMTFENNRYADGPATIGGTGFGVSAIVVAVERGWITRGQAVERLLTLTRFLRDKTARKSLHGAFPHWVNGITGETMPFGAKDIGADIVETAFLMQNLLIAREYFDGRGPEEELRAIITRLWEDVEWDWFAAGPGGREKPENNGMYWHWSPEYGFEMNMKVSGFNECLALYVMALASPTHPIPREAYAYWKSTDEYLPKSGNGYTVEAAMPYTGPLFITHYSFIGIDPFRIADDKVRRGYGIRNVTQALVNRAYCLESAPKEYGYRENLWGLTSCDAPEGYTFNAPGNEHGVIAPTAALSSLPYAPHYAMQVLRELYGPLKKDMIGPWGPYDSLRPSTDPAKRWYARTYNAIDQLPIVCMVENYRSGLLWKLFMRTEEARRGLERAGMAEPHLPPGFPEMVITLKPARDAAGTHIPDACDLALHPDRGVYEIRYRAEAAGTAEFLLRDARGRTLWSAVISAAQGANLLSIPPLPAGTAEEHEILTLHMNTGSSEHELPVRLHGSAFSIE
ncbi:MAG TPA: hypothetical protein H9991_00450 [Candidatus Mailhella excrementigallinarum]|nr:hypothetical protein [Candidatus Mailhella excrementigallinarum]